MAREFTVEEADRHNALTAKGWGLIKGLLILHGHKTPPRPGWLTRWRLRRAVRCFEKALAINPEGWPSMYALGKIYQRLDNQPGALEWFARAHALKPDQPDVAREAGISALNVGRVAEGMEFCLAAVECKPGDPGLVCNLALAYCLAGSDADAERCAAEAVECDPTDAISLEVLGFVRQVACDERQRPERLCDAYPYG